MPIDNSVVYVRPGKHPVKWDLVVGMAYCSISDHDMVVIGGGSNHW